jgi:hypothetical protein
MKRTFLKSVWLSMPIVAAATATSSVICIDSDGTRWMWISSGKRVEAKAVQG